jgi:hypothetical protein
MANIIYNATETSVKFHSSNNFGRINKGPVRSGKSVRSLIEVVRRAQEQAPANDGIRYSKWLIGRKSFPQLKSTTIKTWLHWFPEKHFGKIKWDSPITHHLRFNDVDCEVLFMPFENEFDVDKLKSLELTGGYLNELQYLPESIWKALLERCNSYPPKSYGAPITFSGAWADTNPPSTDHWIYRLDKSCPENISFFHDIPAVVKVDKIPTDVHHAVSRDGTTYINNPDADYIKNLPTALYYLNQIPVLSDEEVKVTCMGNYGFTKVGKPVYPDYNDVIHFINKKIKYNRDEVLYVGLDFGLTPAAVLLQWQPGGTLAVIAEIVSQDYGIETFCENKLVPFLNEHCPGWPSNILSVGDPSGKKGNESNATPGNKNNAFDIMNRFGLNTQACRTNNPEIRIGAVKWFLRKMHNGYGFFRVTQMCPQLQIGFIGNYQYEKTLIMGVEESTKAIPLKNFSSHIHDALQYICVYLRDKMEIPATVYDLKGSEIY